MEKEHPEDEGRDQKVQGHAQFHHEGHAVGGAGGGEEQSVLHGEEPDDLGDRVLSGDHHQKSQHDRGEGDRQGRTRHERRELPDGGREVVGKYDQDDSHQHGGGNVHHRLHFLVDSELDDELVQDVREQDDLHRKRQDGGDVQIVLSADVPNDGCAHGKKEPLPREEMQKRIHPPLHDQGKGRKQDHRRQKTVDLSRKVQVHEIPLQISLSYLRKQVSIGFEDLLQHGFLIKPAPVRLKPGGMAVFNFA